MSITEKALIEVQERYNVKLSKYSAEDIDDELSDVLWNEAYNEAISAGYINGGRKIRR